MNVAALAECELPDRAQALETFESSFTYPLGVHQRFGIRHSPDYLRFFRAMGEAQSFIAIEQGCIVGAIAVALRRLLNPDGQSLRVAYFGDLKIIPEARGGRTFIELTRRASRWVLERSSVAFSIVMEGTTLTPEHYTGRAGLPAFTELAKLAVIRVPNEPCVPTLETLITTDLETHANLFHKLSAGRYATPVLAPHMRSSATPLPFVLADGSACGLVEDTRLAKRLVVADGTELASAHLSQFAYRDAVAGAKLVHAARWHAARLGLPALFFAVYQPDAPALLAALAIEHPTIAAATVYGVGLPGGAGWNINTSEI